MAKRPKVYNGGGLVRVFSASGLGNSLRGWSGLGSQLTDWPGLEARPGGQSGTSVHANGVYLVVQGCTQACTGLIRPRTTAAVGAIARSMRQ